MAESGEQFLHRRDSKLHTTNPVEHEQARRRVAREPVSQRPADKIASFLGVIEKTHLGHSDDPRVIERIKDYYHRQYAIKPEDIPQSYWNLQGEIAVNEGRKQDLINSGVLINETWTEDENGNKVAQKSYIFPSELRGEATRTVISNQQQSLDKWVDYLTSDDAPYPMWAKYWAFRSVVKMGKLEKTEDGKARFANRGRDTTSSFPVLNQRALANTIGAMSARLETKGKPKDQQNTENLSVTLLDTEYQKLLSTEDFSKLYAQFLSEIPEYSSSGLEETRGRWIKYAQGSDPTPLVGSLEGHPLEWCTADIDTARTQLRGGDFYVYYSIDGKGNPVIPRLAIRMEGSRIAEPPRGIAHNQHLDPFINNILEEKLKEFGSEGEAFEKRMSDMKMLTEIARKAQDNKPLTPAELGFLYEIDGKIEGFGYDNQGRDPRIAELRLQRNPDEDMPIVFGCSREQIAHRVNEIRPDTKAYVGPLEKGIFDRLPSHIEHIYTSFPEGRIQRQADRIGGKSAAQLKEELRRDYVNISPYAEDMIDSPDFTTLKDPQDLDTVKLRVQDLGLQGTPTTDQVYARAKELGLELCPLELGLHRRLKDTNQPIGEWYYIAMKPIAGRDGRPNVFNLGRGEDGLWLGHSWAGPDRLWRSDGRFVFGLRKPEPQNRGIFDRIFKR